MNELGTRKIQDLMAKTHNGEEVENWIPDESYFCREVANNLRRLHSM